jgi:hypothetical protein
MRHQALVRNQPGAVKHRAGRWSVISLETHNTGAIPYTFLVRDWHYTTPPPPGKITANQSDTPPPKGLLPCGTLVPLAKAGKCGRIILAATLRKERPGIGFAGQAASWRK